MKFDDFKIKSMLGKAAFVKQNAQNAYNCKKCLHPVYGGVICLNCNTYTCAICYEGGDDMNRLLKCPNCQADPYNTNLMTQEQEGILGEMRIKCVEPSCPGKEVPEDYETFIKNHPPIHFGAKKAACPLLCGAQLTEAAAPDHLEECPNALHENPQQIEEYFVVSHKECRDQINDLKAEITVQAKKITDQAKEITDQAKEITDLAKENTALKQQIKQGPKEEQKQPAQPKEEQKQPESNPIWAVFRQEPKHVNAKTLANWKKVVAKKGFVNEASFEWESIPQGCQFVTDSTPPGWPSSWKYTGWVDQAGKPQGWGRLMGLLYIYEGQFDNGRWVNGCRRQVQGNGRVLDGDEYYNV